MFEYDHSLSLLWVYSYLKLEVYLELPQTSKIKLFAKTVTAWTQWLFFAKKSILDIRQGSKFTSAKYHAAPKITGLESLSKPLKAIWKDAYLLGKLRWLLTLNVWCSIAWKVSSYGVISGPYFPVFGLNTDT